MGECTHILVICVCIMETSSKCHISVPDVVNHGPTQSFLVLDSSVALIPCRVETIHYLYSLASS